MINAGVGDSDPLINEWKAGVLIEDFSEEDYLKAARTQIEMMVSDPGVRESARSVAEQVFDLRRLRESDTRRFTRKF